MTSQQPPEGLSAENRALIEAALDCYARAMWDANRHIGGSDMDRLLNAARSTSPAPDPKAGEREQVAEAVERLTRLACGFPAHINREGVGTVSARWDDLNTVLSALAEARSEVERRAMTIAALEGNLERAEAYGAEQKAAVGAEMDAWLAERNARLSAEAERDTLAAQLVGAREALEKMIHHWEAGDAHDEGAFDADCLDCRVLAEARQALSMSILRGDKGCSLGAIEAPACGSPADSQTSDGAE